MFSRGDSPSLASRLAPALTLAAGLVGCASKDPDVSDSVRSIQVSTLPPLPEPASKEDARRWSDRDVVRQLLDLRTTLIGAVGDNEKFSHAWTPESVKEVKLILEDINYIASLHLQTVLRSGSMYGTEDLKNVKVRDAIAYANIVHESADLLRFLPEHDNEHNKDYFRPGFSAALKRKEIQSFLDLLGEKALFLTGGILAHELEVRQATGEGSVKPGLVETERHRNLIEKVRETRISLAKEIKLPAGEEGGQLVVTPENRKNVVAMIRQLERLLEESMKEERDYDAFESMRKAYTSLASERRNGWEVRTDRDLETSHTSDFHTIDIPLRWLLDELVTEIKSERHSEPRTVVQAEINQ